MSLTAEEFSHVLALFKTKRSSKNGKTRKQHHKVKTLAVNDATIDRYPYFPSSTEAGLVPPKPSDPLPPPRCQSDQAERLVDLSSSYTALTKSEQDEKKFSREVVTLECSLCPKQFLTVQMLRQHFLHMHSDAGFKCQTCFFIATCEKQLHEHKCRVKQVLSCLYCTEKFRSKRDLMIHLKVHDMKYKCESCDRQYADLIRLKKHERDCHSGPTYQCPSCNKNFTNKECFVFHINKTHATKNIHDCNSCQKTFKTEKYLKLHQNLVHRRPLELSNSSPKPVCLYNERVAAAKQVLKNVPNKENTLKFQTLCPDCHKILSSETSVYAHKVLHKNPKVCPKCNAKFPWSWHLNKHMKNCSGIQSASGSDSNKKRRKLYKPYQCFLCNTRFSNGAELTDHMRDHAKLDSNLSLVTTKAVSVSNGQRERDDTREAENAVSTCNPNSVCKHEPKTEERSCKKEYKHCSNKNLTRFLEVSRSFITTSPSFSLTDTELRSRMETPIDFEERTNSSHTFNPISSIAAVNARSVKLTNTVDYSKQGTTVLNDNCSATSTIEHDSNNLQYTSENSSVIYEVNGGIQGNNSSSLIESDSFKKDSVIDIPDTTNFSIVHPDFIDTVQMHNHEDRRTESAVGGLGNAQYQLQHSSDCVTQQQLQTCHSVEGILNEVFDTGGPISPISDSCLNAPYAPYVNSLLLLEDSFVLPHDML